uniref:hypothetical protein n=1 Tax=Vibrio vulnificus TaxID=672 RepID=UPI001EEC87D1
MSLQDLSLQGAFGLAVNTWGGIRKRQCECAPSAYVGEQTVRGDTPGGFYDGVCAIWFFGTKGAVPSQA